VGEDTSLRPEVWAGSDWERPGLGHGGRGGIGDPERVIGGGGRTGSGGECDGFSRARLIVDFAFLPGQELEKGKGWGKIKGWTVWGGHEMGNPRKGRPSLEITTEECIVSEGGKSGAQGHFRKG